MTPVHDEAVPPPAEAIQLLAQLAAGLRPRDIARLRHVPVPRVRREVQDVRALLGATTNIQAAVVAVRRGLI